MDQKDDDLARAEITILKKIRAYYKRIGTASGVATALNIPLWAVEKTLKKGHWRGLHDFDKSYRTRYEPVNSFDNNSLKGDGIINKKIKESEDSPYTAMTKMLPRPNNNSVEIVETCGITREKGWLYYIDAQGDICRVQATIGPYDASMNRAREKVKDLKIKKESGWLYFINNEGNIGRSRSTVGGRAKTAGNKGTVKKKAIKAKKCNAIDKHDLKQKIVSVVANTMRVPKWIVAKAMKNVAWEKLLQFEKLYRE